MSRRADRIDGELAEKIFAKMLAFANFGFPESHSISFASLVYYSAWFKHYYPSAFCVALLNSQPMGFYSPQSLVADARRHGVLARGPDVNLGRAEAVLAPDPRSTGGQAIRLGTADVRGISLDLAEQIDAERARAGPFRDLADLSRRVRLTVPQAEALATAGAFGCFGVDRRSALWAAGVVAAVRSDQLPGTAVGLDAPALPGLRPAQRHLLGGAVGALPHGGGGQRRAAGPRAPGTQPRGCAQPRGRPVAAPGPRGGGEVARLPLTRAR